MHHRRQTLRPWEGGSDSDELVTPEPLRRSIRIFSSEYWRLKEYDGIASSTRASAHRRPLVHDSQPALRHCGCFERIADLLCSRSSSFDPEDRDAVSADLEAARLNDIPDEQRDRSSPELECSPSKDVRPLDITSQGRTSSALEHSVIDSTQGSLEVPGTAPAAIGIPPTRIRRSLVTRDATTAASSEASIIEDAFTLVSDPFRKTQVASSSWVRVTVCFWRGGEGQTT